MRALRVSVALAVLLPVWPTQVMAGFIAQKVRAAASVGIPTIRLAPAAAGALAGPAAPALPQAAAAPAALPQLQSIAAPQPAQGSRPAAAAGEAYDGAAPHAPSEETAGVVPSFEPARQSPARSKGADAQGSGDSAVDRAQKTLTLSFPTPAQVSMLQSFDPAHVLYGSIKRVRPSFKAKKIPASQAKPKSEDDRPRNSREYWAKFKFGVEIDIKSRGETVFATKVTMAFFKTIGKLTREDLAGVVPASELRAPIVQIRKAIVDRLETERKTWRQEDDVVSLDTPVRVVKFKPFAALYREIHGPDSIPKPEQSTPRAPLQTTAEGPLGPLARLLPRAIFLDVDALDGPISSEMLSDMTKLQRTGVYFVAFSRKPYAAAGGLRERLIGRMSAYQLSILMPIRFMAVTDNGAVVSEFPRGGTIVPIDVARFSDSAMSILRDAAQKAAEQAGISGRALTAVAQPPIKEAVDGESRGYSDPKDPQIRYQLSVAKTVDEARLKVWQEAFESRARDQGLEIKVDLSRGEKGSRLVTVQRTDLGSALPRLNAALGARFGLYLNPSDILVLSDNPALVNANPNFDFGGLTGLKGDARVENALGLLLGEHRENLPGDLSGSASRMAQFTRDRSRYMSDFLLKQDGQEQNINFFSGHEIHAANDWLVWNLQNGRRPTEEEYVAHVREHWQAGVREFKPVGLPPGHDMEGWLRESTRRGLSMYRMVLEAADRGEVLVGTEIPNLFMLKDYERRTEKLKRRYILHTIFDFITLRPDPKNPGHATIVIYDFKTGPAQSRQKLSQDIQVRTYERFAHQRWVGREFPMPYFSGKEASYYIDDVSVEFMYNAIRQTATISSRGLEATRHKIIGTLNHINAGEQKMLGLKPAKKKPAKKGPSKKPAAKKHAKKRPLTKRTS